MAGLKTIGAMLYDYIDERVKIKDLVEYMGSKVVPKHGHSIWYYFGGLSLFFFIVQVMSGILLLLYYRPGADSAYESVKFIITGVEFGWLVRSVHSWSANLMVLMVFIHMFSVYFTKAYKKPRELTWLTGMGLFGLSLFFGFSGYLLPWNELAFFATKVGTGMAGAVPVVGDFILQVMRGGDEVTGATVTRFFGWHVAILPAAFTVILSLHLILVQRQGMSEPESWLNKPVSEKLYMPFFPSFLLRDLLLWLIALNVLAVLAVLFPFGIYPFHWELGIKADPFLPPPAIIRPEWYFMFAFQTLKMIPALVMGIEGEILGIFGFSIAGLMWAIVPFLDKSKPGSIKAKLFFCFGLCAVAFILIMTIIGYLVE